MATTEETGETTGATAHQGATMTMTDIQAPAVMIAGVTTMGLRVEAVIDTKMTAAAADVTTTMDIVLLATLMTVGEETAGAEVVVEVEAGVGAEVEDEALIKTLDPRSVVHSHLTEQSLFHNASVRLPDGMFLPLDTNSIQLPKRRRRVSGVRKDFSG